MTIRFLYYLDPELVDYMCNNHDVVEVTIAAYNYEEVLTANGDGTYKRKMERTQKAGFGSTIKSSKDVVQFDNSDMKKLSKHTKQRMR
jgi:hypothetical protein